MDETDPLAARLEAAPLPADAKVARRRLKEFLAEAKEGAPALGALAAQKPVERLLLGLADQAPYLWRLATRDPARLARLLGATPEDAFADLIAKAAAASDSAADSAAIMRALRLAKQEAALLVALCDLGGVWSVLQVTRALSDFADAAVAAALRFALREAIRSGKLQGLDLAAPERGCGVTVLALGKHGARELNYSSDVDLVVFFDPDAPATADSPDRQSLYVRMLKTLVRVLQERTADGYVLRVDLRLRPDPASTSIAVALPAAFAYYESVGQNWERAAFIKARPIAGEPGLGEAFLADLAPFVWRKYFDYAAIADVHAMKRQIHSVRGHEQVTVPGHDVKLGRGGIREIEFFVQTQQLIFGGRRPALRGARTLDMLQALADDGWVETPAVAALGEAYAHLRGVEHRLQMVDDEQTQRLPSDPEALTRFARFCGFRAYEPFAAAMTKTFRAVEAHYARLFEHAPGLDATAGSLVFTGKGDDPETLETLARLGFKDPAAAAETVRGWHFGRRPAVQTARAREVLTELTPSLLDAFSGSGDPDAALAALDTALARMPAAVELFSILKSNAAVRELFADILGAAPRLAAQVAARPHVLDAAIDPASLQASLAPEAADLRVSRALAAADGLEDALDRMRRLAQEDMFLIGVRLLSGAVDAEAAAQAFTALAEALIRAAFAAVTRDFEAAHGAPPGGRAAIVALGRLGSRELTASSDLDLMLIYDFDAKAPESTGPRPLHAVQYYTRLTQRLISALSAPMRSGRLYDVDMRLRPSGNKGPAATQLLGFLAYHDGEAETWERMALTRARVIAGDATLGDPVREAIRAVLTRPRETAALAKDVHDMRMLIAREKGESDRWDLKLAAGGFLDLEFIAQYLALRHAADDARILRQGTAETLAEAGRLGFLDPGEAETLVDAHRLYATVTQATRIAVEGRFDPQKAAEGVLRRIAASANAPDFRRLAADLDARRKAVRGLFEAILRRRAKA